MNHQTKKIIAREFLSLIFVLSAGILVFTGTFVYNWTKDYQWKSTKEEIRTKTELCNKTKNEIQVKRGQLMRGEIRYFTRPGGTKYEIPESKTSEFLIDFPNAVESVKLIIKDGRIATVPINEIDEFLKYYPNAKPLNAKQTKDIKTLENLSNASKTNSLLYGEIIKLKSKQTVYSPTLSFRQQLNISAIVIAVLGIMIFVVRYLFYGVQWSFNVLRTNKT